MIKNNYKLLYALISITTFLSIFAVKFPILISTSSILLYISAIMGYGGLMLILWSFVLGTRSVISIFFDDFLKIVKLHKILAKYGSILALIHPFFVTMSYGETLIFTLLPQFANQFERAITYGRSAFFILIVIWFSSVCLKDSMSHRPWKYIHLLSYLIIPFALLHVPDTGSSYASLIFARIYFFTIVLGFAIFGIIRLRGALNFNKIQYKIISQDEVANNIFVIKLSPLNKRALNPKLGQYVYIKTGWFSEDHPFSVLKYEQINGMISIGYKVYGDFTKKLSTLKNKAVYLSGPFGDFTSDISDKPVIYIAGGIGVTPFIERILNENNKREQWLFYQNKTIASTAFLDELENNLDNRLIKIFSSEKHHGSEFGRINSHTIKKYISNPNKYNYYICGPKTMADSLRNDLKNLGVNACDIHLEAFNF